MMDSSALNALLERLISSWENEIVEFKQANRNKINKLLMDKLSDALDAEQKERKIGNLLTKLRRAGAITNSGSRGHPVWRLAE